MEIGQKSIALVNEKKLRNKKWRDIYYIKRVWFFQVDGKVIDIKEGSVIIVGPEGIRGIRNSSDETIIYIVIQAKENSLEEYTTDDGTRVEFHPKW